MGTDELSQARWCCSRLTEWMDDIRGRQLVVLPLGSLVPQQVGGLALSTKYTVSALK
jgi:hypothetical protein